MMKRLLLPTLFVLVLPSTLPGVARGPFTWLKGNSEASNEIAYHTVNIFNRFKCQADLDQEYSQILLDITRPSTDRSASTENLDAEIEDPHERNIQLVKDGTPHPPLTAHCLFEGDDYTCSWKSGGVLKLNLSRAQKKGDQRRSEVVISGQLSPFRYRVGQEIYCHFADQ